MEFLIMTIFLAVKLVDSLDEDPKPSQREVSLAFVVSIPLV
jgi:hypothetical protein